MELRKTLTLIFVCVASLCSGQMLLNSYAFSNPPTLYYFPVLGQSQAGGYNSDPALTLTADPFVKTLTDGPIDVNTAGDLINLVEGDTYTDTGDGTGPYTDVETIATSFAQQLKTFRNSGNDYYAVTVHASGNRTIQALAKGGASGQFEEVITCVARMKAIADANGWNFETHLIFFHGGTGDNVTTTYKAKLLQLYTDWAADIDTHTDQTHKYLFTHQQRVIGTPDYGQQQYEASVENSNIIVTGPEHKTTYQGDAIHLTNHGTRYLAMQWARAVYYKLFGTGFSPLQLDAANATLNAAGTQITVPVLNATSTIAGTTNMGVQLYSSTTSAVIASTTAVSGSNLIITVTTVDKMPVGSHNLLIRTGVAANGEVHDNSSSANIPTFLALDGNPYNLDKYMVRAEFAKTLVFPVNLTISFGGDGNSLTAPPPGNTTVYEIWTTGNGNVQEKTTVNYPLQGNVSFDILATSSNYFGFTATSQKAGLNVLTGTNFYANNVLQNYYFVENKSVDVRLNGLNASKTYKLIFATLRTGTATNRETSITIGGTTVTKTSNRSGTASVFTTEAECNVFNGIAPNGSGQITFTVNTNGTQFGYLNALQIIEL